MKKLLRIDSSTRGDDSHSRSLADMVEASWREKYKDLQTISKDLSKIDIPHLSQAYIEATFIPEEDRTPEINKLLSLSNNFIAEIKSADLVIVSVPMFNFSIPSNLKAYIDYISRSGETVIIDETGYRGLLTNKKLVIASAYASGHTQKIKEMDFVGPYLKTVFGFLGFDDVKYLALGGTAVFSPKELHDKKIELIKDLI